MSNFRIRTACPSCRCQRLTVLVDTPYSDAPLMDYLERYYKTQGKPDFHRLQGERYRLIECDACKLIFQDRVPNEDFSMELYEVWIDPELVSAMSASADVSTRQFREIRLIKRIIQHLGKPSKMVRALDVGMGWGDWLFAARGLGCQINGLELSPARIAYGKANGINMLNWEGLAGNSFDIINCEQVLEHLDDPRGALEAMQGCLSPGGVIVAGVPNVLPLRARLRSGKGVDWSGKRHTRDSGNPTEAVTPLEHLNSFTGASLRFLARQCGLEEVRFSARDVISTSALDRDSLKDAAKDLLIRLGFVDRFTRVILTHRAARH